MADVFDGAMNQQARDAEFVFNHILAAIPLTKEDLLHVLPHNDDSKTALAGLAHSYPPLDTLARQPNLANILSTMSELCIGHKIKWILDPDTNRVTQIRLIYTGREVIKKSPPPFFEEEDLECEEEEEYSGEGQ